MATVIGAGRTTVTAMAAVCALLLAAAPDGFARGDRMRAPAPQELIVRFKAGAGANERAEARSRAGVRAVRALRSGSQVVRPEPGRGLSRALAGLREDRRVSFAEVNGIVRAAGLTDDPMLTGERLWGLHNTAGSAAFFGGTADSDVDAPEAWDLADGSGVTVAVADTGVAGGHPDLDGRMVPGWNTVDRNSVTTDADGHGTHVAGTIAAEGGNATGVVGVSHAARIMPVKVLGDDGFGTNASVADGFRWAGDNGADVVNASLGGAGFSQEIADAIDAHPGVLFVVAAGNGGEDGVGDDNDAAKGAEYPCRDTSPNLICVAATDAGDRLTSFSNYGTTSVDLGAPGQAILSTAPFQTLFSDDFDDGVLADKWTVDGWLWAEDEYSGFARAAGTSSNVTLAENLSLAGKSGCRVDFWSAQNGQAYFETTTDGTTWTTESLPSGGWSPVSRSLSTSVISLRFRFGTGTGHFYVDDVAVVCAGFDETSYQYLSGTSMATPHVAGAAALVLERLGPTATVARLREALLQSGDPVSALATKTVTGRRLNAHAAAAHFSGLAVTTGAATAVGGTTVTLNGAVDTGGVSTEWFFEYGPTTAYGSLTPVATAAGSSSPVAVQRGISGLTASTTYHFRLVGRRGDRRVLGEDGRFTTAAPPAADEPATSDATTGQETSGGDEPPTGVLPDPIAEMKRTARVACKRRSGRRLACRFTATGATRVVAVVRNRKGRKVGRLRGPTGRRLVTRVRGLRKGRYRLSVAFFDASGRRATVTRRVRLR